VAFEDGAILHPPEPGLQAGARGTHNGFLARHDRTHVRGNRAFDANSEFGRAPCLVDDFGTGDQRFRWRTARVDTGSAEEVALDHGHGHARAREALDH